jgi:hypothetical protein
MGLKEGHSFSLSPHTMVFQADIYAIRPGIMENTERSTKIGTSICYVIVKQPSKHLTASRPALTSLGLPSIPDETGRT